MLESNFPFFSSNFSLGPPETTPQQPPQQYTSKEQVNNSVANTANNTINSTTATTITSASSGHNNTSEMVSRRKILSRSRDDLNLETTYVQEDEDTWHQKDKLFRVSLQLFLKSSFKLSNLAKMLIDAA